MHTDFQKVLEISFLIHKNPCEDYIYYVYRHVKTQENPLVFLTIQLPRPTHKWNKDVFLNQKKQNFKLRNSVFILQ